MAGTGILMQNVLGKQLIPENDAPKKISAIQFGLLSAHDIQQLSQIRVVNRELYTLPERTPFPYGVLDTRLGTSSKSDSCSTCGLKVANCVGHFGYVKLELPVFHIGYFKNILNICQSICKNCSRVLLPDSVAEGYLRRLRVPGIEILSKKKIAETVLVACKKVRACPHCGFYNNMVKKVGPFRLLHERYSRSRATDLHVKDFHANFEEAMKHNKDVKQFLQRAQDDLNPYRVLWLFENISATDCELLDMSNEHSRPEHLIVRYVLVPPVCLRPSVQMGTGQGSNEDDLTMKLTEIIHINNTLRTAMEKGASLAILMENWDFLQLQCALYINSEIAGLPLSMQLASKPGRSFVQRLKGKQGRFRGNLSGKRVDFSGRTVISPDPNLEIHQVGVPRAMAMVLTFPQRVNRYNMALMRQLVETGPSSHPGANFVEKGDKRFFLKYGDRSRIAKDLKIGDIVERHLMDGDKVLFNRQPSLHKLSIMCHEAKVMPWRTLRFNECACGPYNADFDGDEMNLHLPQTEEARAEASILLGLTNNLMTPRNGEIIIAATQDFLTAGWLLTKKNSFFDRSMVSKLCAYMQDAKNPVVLPRPAIMKPVELWTGKQIFTLLLSPERKPEHRISLREEAKNYSGKGLAMCEKDGYVVIRNSELLCGSLDKKLLGSGNRNSVFSVLMREISPRYATQCMGRLAKFTARFLLHKGFSIGIDDVTPGETLLAQKAELLERGERECEEFIQSFQKGALECQPGCSPEQTLEASVTATLNQIRGEAGKVCVKELHWRNAALNMALAGSKGSPLNISQMVACVGQQAVGGQRIPNGFVERSLPHFFKSDRSPAAKGFVANSFFSGLTPTEFFFHTMGGREGLVDTAVKTAETGYMQRRLMKTLEDLSVSYDGSVRNCERGVVQFNYGDDGQDPSSMEGTLDPSNSKSLSCSAVDFNRTLMYAKAVHPSTIPTILTAAQLRQAVDEIVKSNPHARTAGSYFVSMVMKYMNGLIQVRENQEIETQGLIEQGADKQKAEASLAMSPDNLTLAQIKELLDTCFLKFSRASIEPGTAVGALAGQSIGEPGTQMTLKTFHFAGVASMNVTLGVPRIKEIINAAKIISTPIITAYLDVEDTESVARIVKGRIEKTKLGEVSKYLRELFENDQSHITIKLDLDAIDKLQLDISVEGVKKAILRSKIKIKPENIFTNGVDKIMVRPHDRSREKMIYEVHALKTALPEVIVAGIPTVERAVIHHQTKNQSKLELLVEGTGLLNVMGTLGVNGRKTSSTHIIEVEKTLGIEAARVMIIEQIEYTMGMYGIEIDRRHVMLLADVMTYKGAILGITRFGLSKMKESVLMLASFEKTTDHLFDAAAHARKDHVVGISECIIMGIPIPIGTGCFKLVQRLRKVKLKPSLPLLLDSTERAFNPITRK
eukprot:c20097_g2_i2.p1 GENE.c20097_g2_i2~~c20097_g2_i2.p1  ORF type:complete len:1413 (-),score=323.94 c20097_g2_i2:41-4279(-)